MRQNQLLFSWKLLSTFKTSGIRMRIQLHSNFDQHTFFQAKVLISNLRLEPAVFIFYICYGIFFVTNQQLYIEKACKVWCPSSPNTSQENHHHPHHQHDHRDWQGQPWPQRQCLRQHRRVPRNSNEVAEADCSGAGDEHSCQACPYLGRLAEWQCTLHISWKCPFCLFFFFLSQILDYGQGSERSTAEPTNHCCRLLCRANLWQVSSTLMPIPDISWPFTPLWQVFEKASDSCELGRLPPSQYHLCRQCLLVLRAQGVSTKTTQFKFVASE